jgi:hypothetical protein
VLEITPVERFIRRIFRTVSRDGYQRIARRLRFAEVPYAVYELAIPFIFDTRIYDTRLGSADLRFLRHPSKFDQHGSFLLSDELGEHQSAEAANRRPGQGGHTTSSCQRARHALADTLFRPAWKIVIFPLAARFWTSLSSMTRPRVALGVLECWSVTNWINRNIHRSNRERPSRRSINDSLPCERVPMQDDSQSKGSADAIHDVRYAVYCRITAAGARHSAKVLGRERLHRDDATTPRAVGRAVSRWARCGIRHAPQPSGYGAE